MGTGFGGGTWCDAGHIFTFSVPVEVTVAMLIIPRAMSNARINLIFFMQHLLS